MSDAGGEHRSAVALLSGGLDSVVAAAHWLARGGRLAACLTFDYGQRAAVPERRAAQRFCERRSIPWFPVELPWLASVSARAGSALMAGARDLPTGSVDAPGDAHSAAAVWVPARNCVFLSIAAAYAEAEHAGCVLCGFNREEAATFPDNSVEFVARGSAFLGLGTRNGVTVEAPVAGLDKPAIVTLARRFGIGPSDLWSCYRGDPSPCGRCESCLRSERAWRLASG